MCANKMPNLRIPYSAVTAEELTIIQPLLDHIKDCLCAGALPSSCNGLGTSLRSQTERQDGHHCSSRSRALERA